MGWVGAETVVHEHDGDRLIRSTVTRESEWDAEQLNLMLAFQQLDSQIGPHGHSMRDAMDPDVKWRVSAVTDYAQKAREQTRAQFRKDYPDDPMHGVDFVVEKL